MKSNFYDFLAGALTVLAITIFCTLTMYITKWSIYPFTAAIYAIHFIKLALPILGIFTLGKMLRSGYSKMFKKVPNV